MKRILMDDYNRSIPTEQSVVGTITTMFGNPAPRHGWKLIEVYETEDSPDREVLQDLRG